MYKKTMARTLSLFSLLFFLSFSASAFEVPRLIGPVNDYAKMLDRSTASQLDQILKRIKNNGGSKIVVLTVPNLDGTTIEQASIQVVDKWKLGDDKKDDGVLLLVTKKERRIRIETGQGVEGDLTDAHSKRIIDEVMVPLFRSGDTSQGILLGTYNIATKSNPKMDIKSYFGNQNWETKQPVRKKRRGISIIPIIFIIIFLFMGRGRGGGSSALLAGMILGNMGGRSYGGGGFGAAADSVAVVPQEAGSD